MPSAQQSAQRGSAPNGRDMRELLAFKISLFGIRAGLLALFGLFCASAWPHVCASVEGGLGAARWAEFFSQPRSILLGLDGALLALFFTRAMPFEFLQLKAFACAGFFAYAAYCLGDSPQGWLLPLCYALLGLLTRRLGAFLGAVLAVSLAAALAALVFCTTTKI